MTIYKTKLIVNPNADKGNAWRLTADLQPLVDKFGGADSCGTVYSLHATELAAEAARSGYNLVIAVGGDGTVHEVINGLMQVPLDERPRFGIIPLGSGNDFAHTIGIKKNPIEALKDIYTGKPKRIDLGMFDLGRGKPEYFNNTFGIGFDATVTIRTRRMTRLRGFLMYLVAVLQTIAYNLDAPRMEITTDVESWSGKTLMFTLCNGPREGGGFTVAPGADVSDGVLNYASVCSVSRLMMLRLIPEVMNGTHGRFKQVRLGNFHRVKILSEKPVTIHADGEVISGLNGDIKAINIEVVPGALEIMI